MRPTTFGFLGLACALSVLPASASAPGTPIDCSDWVAVDPSYTCTELTDPYNSSCMGLPCTGETYELDNLGRHIRWADPFWDFCGNFQVDQTQIQVFENKAWHVI